MSLQVSGSGLKATRMEKGNEEAEVPVKLRDFPRLSVV